MIRNSTKRPRLSRPMLASAAIVFFTIVASRPASAQFEVQRIASGLSSPLYVTSAPGDNDRVFILEQGGDIEIYKHSTGAVNGAPFLDLTSSISSSSERGLLGLAFDPDYQTNGLFYVNVTNTSGDTEIRRYQVSTDPDQANSSGTVILSYDQPAGNHNGGWIGFNPIPNAANDNQQYLYIAAGDGGGSGDPNGNGQNPHTLLGSILRIDVDAATYNVPASNPFSDGADGAPEVWAYGLRNPWRDSFDRQTGDFYIGDVGQNVWEEVDVQLASSTGGENYGWNEVEGLHSYSGGTKPAGAIDPIYEYSHSVGIAVTGGYVYRGPVADLQGQYIFADYGSARIWSLQFDGSDPTTHDGTNFTNFMERTTQFTPDVGNIDSVSSFGEDNAGNLYIVDLGGEVFMVVPVPEPSTSALALAALAIAAVGGWRLRRTGFGA